MEFFSADQNDVYCNTTYSMLFKICLRLTEEMMYKYEIIYFIKTPTVQIKNDFSFIPGSHKRDSIIATFSF